MKISIIVPNLTGEIYLQDCEASIAAQSSKNGSHIGLRRRSDGSDTGAGIILETIIENDDKNNPKGVAAMRNLGLEAASGDFVLFVDSDDYISDDAIEQLIEETKRFPGELVGLKIKKTRYKRDGELAEEEKRRQGSDPVSSDVLSECFKSTESENAMSDSILGILIQAEFVKGKNGLRFNEHLKYYSDIPFITELLVRAGVSDIKRTEGIYYKRSRNDAIRYPALSQLKDDLRYAEFAAACREAAACIESAQKADSGAAQSVQEELSDSGAARSVQDKLWKYICGFICDRLTKGKHPEGLEWNEKQLKAAACALTDVAAEFIRSMYSGALRRILIRLKTGKYIPAQRTARFYVMNRKKKGLFGSVSQWKWNIYKRVFKKLPVKRNLFLFESFLGKSYGDSCRAIYEYMLQAIYPEFRGGAASDQIQYHYGGFAGGSPDSLRNIKFVWIIDNKDAKIPGRHKETRPLSLRYFYYVARCGAWINNMRQPAWYEKREGVRFLETWHGTPLKKLVFDMEDVHSASPEYKMTFYMQSRIWDWLISDNRFSTDAFESAFLFERTRILETGYPRNDLLYGKDIAQRAAAVKEKLGIPKDKKVVLYAPTWRDDDYYGPGQYRFELPLDLDVMEKLKDRYFFVLRTHYFIADNLKLDESRKSFVMDCSRYNDIGELYLISDVLITDYSSVFFDFANLRRPILFYVYDFERYRDQLRGFYFDMETGCPGPLLYTSGEVAEALEELQSVEERYADKYREFTERFCSLDDGRAAERVVKKVFKEFDI